MKKGERQAPIFGAFLSRLSSSPRHSSLWLFVCLAPFAVSYSICVCLLVMCSLSGLTTTGRRAMCLRQPHTEPVVVLFFGSRELLTNTREISEAVGRVKVGQFPKKAKGEKTTRAGRHKGKRLVWCHSLPYGVTLSTWHDLSHFSEVERMPFCWQIDSHTLTQRHTNKLVHICLRPSDSSPKQKAIYSTLPL